MNKEKYINLINKLYEIKIICDIIIKDSYEIAKANQTVSDSIIYDLMSSPNANIYNNNLNLDYSTENIIENTEKCQSNSPKDFIFADNEDKEYTISDNDSNKENYNLNHNKIHNIDNDNQIDNIFKKNSKLDRLSNANLYEMNESNYSGIEIEDKNNEIENDNEFEKLNVTNELMKNPNTLINDYYLESNQDFNIVINNKESANKLNKSSFNGSISVEELNNNEKYEISEKNKEKQINNNNHMNLIETNVEEDKSLDMSVFLEKNFPKLNESTKLNNQNLQKMVQQSSRKLNFKYNKARSDHKLSIKSDLDGSKMSNNDSNSRNNDEEVEDKKLTLPKKTFYRRNSDITGLNTNKLNDTNKSWLNSRIFKNVNSYYKGKKVRKSTILGQRLLDMSRNDLNQFNKLVMDLNSYPSCVFILNSHLDFIFYNKYSCEYLLYDKWELVDKQLSIILKNDSFIKNSSIIMDLVNKVIETNRIGEEKEFTIESMEMIIYDKGNKESKFNVTVEPRLYYNNSEDLKCYLVMTCSMLDNQDYYFVIDPRHPIYLFYSVIILIVVLVLLFYVPYDIAFGTIYLEEFNWYFDNFTTVLFTIDIFLNFFIAELDKEGNYIFDNYTISINYFKRSFLFDFIATFPLYEIINVNTSIIKGIRIMKIIKIVKILKISKIVSLRNKKIKELIGNEIIAILKRTSGIFELIMQNFYILIGAHYFSIIFFFVKTNYLNEIPGDIVWVENLYNIPSDNLFRIYVFMLSENLKTAVGLGVNILTDPYEILLQMIWIFIGLSMFGYGIGNISSYLNYSNHMEIEYYDNKSFFAEVCDNYNIDPRIYALIKKDIENHYRNYNDSKLYNKASILSKGVFNQLESIIYEDYIVRFSFFNKISIPIIRYMRMHTVFHKGHINLLKGSVVCNVYFVIKGKLTFFDSNMKLVNKYQGDEMYGFTKFLTWINIKYNFDIDKILDLNDNGESTDNTYVYHSKENLIRLEKCREYISELYYKKNVEKNNLKNDFENLINIGKSVDFSNKIAKTEDNIQLVNEYIPVTSQDLESFSIPFSALESILVSELDTFMNFYKHYKIQHLPITLQEKIASREAMKTFRKSTIPALMIDLSGEIKKINQRFINKEEKLAEYLYGFDIKQALKPKGNSSILKSPEDIKPGQIYLLRDKSGDYVKQLEIGEVQRYKLVNGGSDSAYDSVIDIYGYYNLKKSLEEVIVIYFDMLKYFEEDFLDFD